jgi:small-conductance mechanosensitive channel
MAQDLWVVLQPLALLLLTALVAVAVVETAHRVLQHAGRRVPLLRELARREHRPMLCLAVVLTTLIVVSTTWEPSDWRGPVKHALLLATIGSGGWLVGTLLLVLEDVALSRFRGDIENSLGTRRGRTRIMILRRVSTSFVVVMTIGVALTTYPTIRTFGMTMLASAGLLGVIVGLAAQPLLSNLIAGLQIVFGNALRVDDEVVVEGEWGTIEDLTLSYVVVNIWDGRRLIVPTSYFTSRPFRHLTHSGAALIGAIELDVDWSVPIAEMRAELVSFCTDHPLWDSRAIGLQAVATTGAMVRIRAIVSAANGDKMWELCCDVREHLIDWTRTNHPQALPRVRASIVEPP